MVEFQCYDCQQYVAVALDEDYYMVGIGDYIVECGDSVGHVLINIDNGKEMYI